MFETHMVERIFDLCDDLGNPRIMLSFKGKLTPELITALLNLVEHKMQLSDLDQRVKKRVFNVVMECLQNIHLHNSRKIVPTEESLGEDAPQDVLRITQNETGFSVLTGNLMAKSDVSALKRHLDHVNGCELEQLRDLYKTTLNDGRYTRVGGGGLGLIDIARKSGRKLEYGFVPRDNNNTFFSLNVHITS